MVNETGQNTESMSCNRPLYLSADLEKETDPVK